MICDLLCNFCSLGTALLSINVRIRGLFLCKIMTDKIIAQLQREIPSRFLFCRVLHIVRAKSMCIVLLRDSDTTDSRSYMLYNMMKQTMQPIVTAYIHGHIVPNTCITCSIATLLTNHCEDTHSLSRLFID